MPINNKVVIITEDAISAAMISYMFNEDGKYVTVLEPPRMQRPDADNEVIRISNVIARIRPALTILVGIGREAEEAIQRSIAGAILPLSSFDEFEKFSGDTSRWKSMTSEQAVSFLVAEKGKLQLPIKAVVYNGPADIGYVIAANYAIYHKAKLIRFDSAKGLPEQIVRKLNTIDSIKDPAIKAIDIKSLKDELAGYLPQSLKANGFDKTMIITQGIPYGLVWPGKKVIYSSRLMLGSFLAHNIYEKEWGEYERKGVIGLYVADRELEEKGEYDSFESGLLKAVGLTKRLYTTHPKITELDIMTVPYDLLYIATHGKQLQGHLEVYEFTDESGLGHSVVIKRAYGLISTVFFIQEVDGVEKDGNGWTDDHGRVWGEFTQRYSIQGNELPEPVKSERTTLNMRALVLGDEAGLHSPFAVQRLASGQRPIVVANACGSWTDMSSLFMFAGAAAYIGTLWGVNSSVAAKFASKFNELLFDKELFDAFLEARGSLDDELDKENYIFTGSFENKYDSNMPFTGDGLTELKKRVRSLLKRTRQRVKEFTRDTPRDIRNNSNIDVYWYLQILKDLKKAGDKELSEKPPKKLKKSRKKRK